MVHLLTKLAELLHETDRREAIAQELSVVATAGREIELEPTREHSDAGVMRARLLEVNEQELFIDAPQIDGSNRPLVRNEPLRLTVRIAGNLLCGDVQTIGRARRDHDGEPVYGYRLTTPTQLAPPKPGSQRDSGVALKPRHYVVEAELRSLKLDVPVRGVIAALSEKMVHVRSMNAPPWLKEGERLSFAAELPRPVGAVEQTVTVNTMRRVDDRGMTMIGMTFVVPMHGLSGLLQHGPIRWG